MDTFTSRHIEISPPHVQLHTFQTFSPFCPGAPVNPILPVSPCKQKGSIYFDCAFTHKHDAGGDDVLSEHQPGSVTGQGLVQTHQGIKVKQSTIVRG